MSAVPPRMPAVFIGHGSPMNAIEDSPWASHWAALAQRLPRPRAVLCISAHWETRGVAATAAAQPPTIHDFGGFPPELHRYDYPAQGDAPLLARLHQLVPGLSDDPVRGYDHGSWSVLCRMYPAADVPLLQLSLDRTRTAAAHVELGHALRPLRDEGVLILGSGNIVHNLRLCDFGMSGGHAWAERFDRLHAEALRAGDQAAMIDPLRIDAQAPLSIPTPEHYLPLLYVLGARHDDEPPQFFNEQLTLGAISMRSVVFGRC